MTVRPTETDVSAAITALLLEHGSVTSGALAERLSVSRQAAHAHLRAAVERGELRRTGAGRAARYVAPAFRAKYAPAGLDEEDVWRDVERALDERFSVTREARVRAHYAVTEVVNNAIDHADAHEIGVEVERVESLGEPLAKLVVTDDGVGAIARAGEGLDVESDAEVIVELSKGKRTTAPERHSGEGLFFTSKVSRRFMLEANGLAWIVDNAIEDEGIAVSDVTQGTRVTLTLDPDTREPLEDVFARFTIGFAFVRTRVHVKLLDFGETLISRSQAKRLTARLERFVEVELDFEGVRGVGQGFVDEVFRVWARAHPETRLVPTHMNEAVRFMVERGLKSGD